MKLRWWRNATEMAEDFARRGPPQSDADFLAECGLPDNPGVVRLALAVRRSVSSYGAVAPEFIRASHLYPDDLAQLSGWDCLDFVGWVLKLEQELAARVDGSWLGSLPIPFSVRDLVWAVLKQEHGVA